jgi:hypothetical protein
MPDLINKKTSNKTKQKIIFNPTLKVVETMKTQHHKLQFEIGNKDMYRVDIPHAQ